MAGRVVIARELMRHEVFKNQQHTEREAFIWLIMEAAYKPKTKNINNVPFEIKRGQIAVSMSFMATAWGWPKGAVNRFLTKLKRWDMIETHGKSGGTIITLCNYDKYQMGATKKRNANGTQDERNPERGRNADGTQSGTQERLASDCKQTKNSKEKNENGTRTERKKNESETQTERKCNEKRKQLNKGINNKEIKNKEYNTRARRGDDVLTVLERVVKPETALAFLEHRNEIKKPMTKRAAEIIANKVSLHPRPDAVLEQSIMNGWAGVFPDKAEKPKRDHVTDHLRANGIF